MKIQKFIIMLLHVLLIVFAVSTAEVFSEEQQNPPVGKPVSSFIKLPPTKTAEDYFKEAKLKAETKPDEAIRLYLRGLLLKPDEWQVHAYMGALYEKQGLIVLALPEYELVSRRLPSAMSSIDYARVLGLTGHSMDSAMVAESGANKYADNFILQLMAGDRLIEAGLHERAIKYLAQAAFLKPDSAEVSASLGAAYEAAGKPVEALTSYDKALSSAQSTKRAIEGRKRLLAKAVTGRGFLLFPPPEWASVSDSLINSRDGQTILIIYDGKDGVKETAASLAARAMPEVLLESKQLDEAAIAAKMEYHKTNLGKSVTREEIVDLSRPNDTPVVVKTVETLVGLGFPAEIACSTYSFGQKTIQCSCVLTFKPGNNLVSFLTKNDKPVDESKLVLLGLSNKIVPYSLEENGGPK